MVACPVLPGSVRSPAFEPAAAARVVATNGSELVMVPAVVLPSSMCDWFEMAVADVPRGITPEAWPETVPEPAGVAHVPSPRQKVVLEADVPLLSSVTGIYAPVPVNAPPMAAPLMVGDVSVLFVSVSVVARPTNVSEASCTVHVRAAVGEPVSSIEPVPNVPEP